MEELLFTEAFNLLKSQIREPLVLIDVGGRWGALEFWSEFEEKAKTICFEADAEEAARLTAENKDPHIEYVPLALGANSDGLRIHITEGPGCSSAYEPISALYEKYPFCEVMRPARTIDCPSTTLDKFCAERGITRIDGLKLDTQGSELDILKGAESVIRTCSFIVVEVEFNALYKDQPLFCDVDRHLRDRGFTLWRLNGLAHYSTGLLDSVQHPVALSVAPGAWGYVPVDNGQLFFADAFYVKADAVPTSSASLPFNDAIAGAALSCQWRLWDLALEMVRKAGANELFSKLSEEIQDGSRILPLDEQVEALTQENAALKAKIAELERGVGPWIKKLFRAA